MQDSLNYRHAQFGYDCTIEKKKEMLKEGGAGVQWTAPSPSHTYLTSKKPNPCRVEI